MHPSPHLPRRHSTPPRESGQQLFYEGRRVLVTATPLGLGCAEEAVVNNRGTGQRICVPTGLYLQTAESDVISMHHGLYSSDFFSAITIVKTALTCVAQWVGRRPTTQRAAGSIPSQGAGLGCGPGCTGLGGGGATNQCFSLTSVFLSLSFSLPSPLYK